MVLSSESMLFWHFSHDQQPWTPGFPHRYLPQHPLRAPHHQPGPSGHIHCPGRAGLHPGHQPTAHGLCSQHCSKFVFCSAWSCCNVLDGSFRGPVERLMNSKFTKFFICNLLKLKKKIIMITAIQNKTKIWFRNLMLFWETRVKSSLSVDFSDFTTGCRRL